MTETNWPDPITESPYEHRKKKKLQTGEMKRDPILPKKIRVGLCLLVLAFLAVGLTQITLNRDSGGLSNDELLQRSVIEGYMRALEREKLRDQGNATIWDTSWYYGD